MIPRDCIIAWGVDHPWPEPDQIEQDLLLSQAICEIAKDDLLGNELALRGGTAFHKLFMPTPYRYSEDLDYVRSTEGGIGEVTGRLMDIGKELGFQVSTRMGKYPKVFWKYTADSGISSKIKIEINTFERSPAFGFYFIEHSVDSPYYSGTSNVRTFYKEELVSTKIRALYQRSKGRDLYDIWLALTELKLSPERILEAFPIYRPEHMTAKNYISNLHDKLSDAQFTSDIENLLRQDAPAYNVQAAGNLIETVLISKL